MYRPPRCWGLQHNRAGFFTGLRLQQCSGSHDHGCWTERNDSPDAGIVQDMHVLFLPSATPYCAPFPLPSPQDLFSLFSLGACSNLTLAEFSVDNARVPFTLGVVQVNYAGEDIGGGGGATVPS
jgi:hypothetical protein